VGLCTKPIVGVSAPVVGTTSLKNLEDIIGVLSFDLGHANNLSNIAL
jgi:hypothetical protein